MPAKSFNLSVEALAFLETTPGKNASVALDRLIKEYKDLSPELRRQNALNKLREGAATLKDLDTPADAILSWVKGVIGVIGEE